jgi:hypothetical protein
LNTDTARTTARLLACLAGACVLALGVVGAASASAPFATQMPSITQSGNTLTLNNGGWMTYSGDVDRYVFRFTRNGTVVKGPTDMPSSSPPDQHFAGEYPLDSQANVYQLSAGESGQFCGDVWAGTHSVYAGFYDVVEWGHADLNGNPTQTCITVGSGTGGGGGSGGSGGGGGGPGVPPFTLAPGGLPTGVTGTAYPTHTLYATGGTPPYTYVLQSGALPAGLVLKTTGAITGTPTRASSAQFAVEARDAAGRVATRSYTIEVVWPKVAISPTELPEAVSDEPFSVQLVAAGGSAPYAFRLAEGVLPTGLSLGAAGLLSGTPSARARTFRFVVSATDANGAPASSAYSLALLPAELTLAGSPGSARVGKAYVARLNVAGGAAPYRFVELDGTLAPGLRLTAAGIVRGVPTRAGSYRVQVRVYDAHDASGDRWYRIVVRRKR